MTHTSAAIKVGGVSAAHIASNVPNAVATPFPPRNPSHGEYRCPSNEATAVDNQSHWSDGESSLGTFPQRPCATPAAATGMAPLSASSTKHRSPHRHPSTRPTLVAPMLREPCTRTSMPRALPMSTPNGIEPLRYATAMNAAQENAE